MKFERLLQKIMDSYVNIRHSIVADAEGNTIAVNHRKGVTDYLSDEERATSLKQAASGWKARKQLSSKMGMGLYAVSVFEKITRITFPLGENNLLLVSIGSEKNRTDLNEGGQQQIVQHVLNLLGKNPTTE